MVDTVTSRGLDEGRATNVASAGLVLQSLAFGLLLAVGIWKQSDAIVAAARFALPGIPVWFVLLLIFKQLKRVTAEELETDELRRARADGAASDGLFGMDDEALLLEQNRLRWLIRWFLPTTTLLVIALVLGGHFVGWRWTLDKVFGEGGLRRTQDPTMVMWVVVAVGLISFLAARYVIALSRFPNWRLLRAGASCMAGNALACLAIVIVLMASTSAVWLEPLVAYVIRVALVILGIELIGNFVLDFYRPQTPGVVARPSFDSRLLGLISEPGGIAKSIAESVNYQFGFEVSSTWFYQLLQRWLFPITMFTFAAVIALTSVVVVDADEAAVVERFGRPLGEASTVLSPGVHFKAPWPFDVVRRAPVKRLHELVIGEATQKEPKHAEQAILWTEDHDFVPELMLLVAAPKSAVQGKVSGGAASDSKSTSGATASVAVNLLMVSMPVEFRIKDLKKYLYGYDEPIKLVEAVSYQVLSDFAAGVDLDEMIGAKRAGFDDQLRKLIQDRLDSLDGGIEIVFAGLRGAHPPSKDSVAAMFHSVVNAETRKSATVEAALGEAGRMLTAVAGTEARARALDVAIRERDRLQGEAKVDATKLSEAERKVEELMSGEVSKNIAASTGEAAALISDSRAAASELIARVENKERAFSTEVAAWKAAPDLYVRRKVLELFRDMDGVRKYLLVSDPSSVIIEYETTQEGGLDRVLGEGLDSERKKSGG